MDFNSKFCFSSNALLQFFSFLMAKKISAKRITDKILSV